MLGVVFLVLALAFFHPARHLGFEERLFLEHPAVAHRLVLGGIGLHLRAVERDVAELHQPLLAAHPQDLREQPGERVQVNSAELADP